MEHLTATKTLFEAIDHVGIAVADFDEAVRYYADVFGKGRPEYAIPTGTLLNAELHGPSGQTFTILACVVHVSAAAEGGHLLGCNFIRELSETDLRSLM